ncbi:DUF4055 domain-containing protein [Pseudomonas fluorescens]
MSLLTRTVAGCFDPSLLTTSTVLQRTWHQSHSPGQLSSKAKLTRSWPTSTSKPWTVKAQVSHGLCSTTFEDALWNGSSFIAMDAAVDGGRPYAYHLSGDNILGYRLDEDDRLIEIRIQEKAVVADGQWGEKEVSRVKVFKRDGDVVTWSLYDCESTDTPIVLDQPFALKEIPVAPVHSSAVVSSGELFAHPPLKDLVYMNVQHYQESSDRSNILRIARVPVLFASGVADDAAIAIGSEYAIKGETAKVRRTLRSRHWCWP